MKQRISLSTMDGGFLRYVDIHPREVPPAAVVWRKRIFLKIAHEDGITWQYLETLPVELPYDAGSL